MDSTLEIAIKTAIERLRYLEEWGSFTPNDEWMLNPNFSQIRLKVS